MEKMSQMSRCPGMPTIKEVERKIESTTKPFDGIHCCR